MGGVPETLAMVCKQGGSGQVKKWAALAVACTLMVETVRKEALDLDQGASVVSLTECVLLLGASVVSAVAPLLHVPDNRQRFSLKSILAVAL